MEDLAGVPWELGSYLNEYPFKCANCQILIKISVNSSDTKNFKTKTINCPFCPTKIEFDRKSFLEEQRFDR